MKPILCRLCACFAPGLPRPTKRRMTRHPAPGYFFLSAAGAFAPAAAAGAAPAAGLRPGRVCRVHARQGNGDADGGASAEPHEIAMERKIPHRIELDVPRDHAVLVALEIDVVNRGEKSPRQNALTQLGIVDRNG